MNKKEGSRKEMVASGERSCNKGVPYAWGGGGGEEWNSNDPVVKRKQKGRGQILVQNGQKWGRQLQSHQGKKKGA